MPDQRKHRGPHPDDARLFAPAMHQTLATAVADLSWLLTRGYASPSAVKIVGDRYALDARQRTAVMRCACPDDALAQRLSRLVPVNELAGQPLDIDGYNLLTTIEVALSGGVILLARDGTFRDIASMHGSYRKVTETLPALDLIGQTLHAGGVARAVWYFDQPVSNSGRLKTILLDLSRDKGWSWDVHLVPNPDPLLSASSHIIATADSVILDAPVRWTNLAREVVTRCVAGANVVPLAD
jgi:hypothetical protein